MLRHIFTAFLSFPFLVNFLCQASQFNLNHLHTFQLQTRNFETAIEGYALNSSLVFLSLNVSTEHECMFKCLLFRDCFSYNLVPKEGEGMICELCSKERFGGVVHFINKTGYRHRSTVSSCSSQPCVGQNVCIPDLQTTTSYLCWIPNIDVEIKAYSLSDTSLPTGSHFQDSYIKINGKRFMKMGRGHNFYVVRYIGNAFVLSTSNFDTFSDRAASSKMASYVNTIPANSIVLVAVVDTGDRYQNVDALTSIGAISPHLSFRQSWAFLGFKGERKSWMVEKKKDPTFGPAFASTRIPFSDFI